MIFDILIIFILAVSMVLGFRSGFLYACIHTVGWLLAVLMGFIWSPKLCILLNEKTKLPESLENAFYSRFSESFSTADETLQQLPSILSSLIQRTETAFVSQAAQTMADLCLSILAFLLTALAVKLLLWVLTETLSRKQNHGFTGLADGILGLAAGFLRGVLIVFFGLALLVPLCSFLAPETSSSIMGTLSGSMFAKDLYDNNLLMLIVRDFIA